MGRRQRSVLKVILPNDQKEEKVRVPNNFRLTSFPSSHECLSRVTIFRMAMRKMVTQYFNSYTKNYGTAENGYATQTLCGTHDTSPHHAMVLVHDTQVHSFSLGLWWMAVIFVTSNSLYVRLVLFILVTMTTRTTPPTTMLPLTMTRRRNHNSSSSSSSSNSGSLCKPSCLFQSLVPAALLGFGALSLLLAHNSLGGDSLQAERGSTSKFVQDMVYQQRQSQSQSQQATSLAADPYFEHYPPDRYQEAFYLDDEPDYETPQRVYEDSHIQQLLAADSTHVPFNIHRHPNGTSVLTAAGDVHRVFTALRDVATTEEFFNPVCFRYRFPNVTVFPTMSVIVPMQNGACVCV